MAKLAVPRQYQQTALMIGIVLALVMRGIFIAVGAAAINQFSWVFYLFGAFLIYTAVNLAKDGDDDERAVRRAADRGRSPAEPPAGHRRVERRQAVHRRRTASAWSRRC